jgi:hypothetical protein
LQIWTTIHWNFYIRPFRSFLLLFFISIYCTVWTGFGFSLLFSLFPGMLCCES